MVTIAATPVAHLFWEHDLTRRHELSADTVCTRVMERGTIEDARWLLRTQSREELTAWFQAHAARHCSARTLALWSCVLECPAPVSSAIPWRHDD